jgi:hypothetical protein
MITYDLDSSLYFGRFFGFSIRDILFKGETSYLQWCILNVKGFNLTDATVEHIKTIDVSFDQIKGVREELDRKHLILLRINELLDEQQRIKYIKRDLIDNYIALKEVKARGLEIYAELQSYK